MNGLEYADATEFESSELGESSEWGEMAEARRRRTPARPGRYAQPPPQRGMVTRREFQEALDKVRNDVAQNARAISSVGTQIDALSKRTQRETKALRDEVTRSRDETRNTLQTLAILPLLASGGTVQVLDTTSPTQQMVLVTTPPDSLMQVLPLLMLSGLGGMGGTGASPGTGMDSGLMLAVALMAAGGKK